jgi:tetratricopeptide (TPR) repeat protein
VFGGTGDSRIIKRVSTTPAWHHPTMSAAIERWEPPNDPGDTLIAPTRLTRGAEKLIGREDDLKRIDDASLDPKTHILTIVAWGGVGKTSLVVEWMNRRAADSWPGFERVFDWSFYSQGTREQGTASADSFVAEALKFFGDEPMANSPTSPWDKGARLAQLIAARRTLLVLDGLEPLQHTSVPLAGQLKDPAIEALLKGLARQRNPGFCIVTTREHVADLKPFRDTSAPEWELKNLSLTAGVELLKTLGAQGTGEEFEKLVKDVTGHALTLNLIGRFLAQAFHGDIRKRDLVKFEEADAEIQGGHAFRVMEAYEKWFFTGDEKAKRQLAVLRLLGLFDRPADAGCLAALRKTPVIAKLSNPFFHRCKGLAGFFGKVQPISDSEWNLAISRLAECGLVSYSKPTHAATSDLGLLTLDSHPLIRAYFAKQLREKNPKGWRSAHRRLYEHLKSSTNDKLTLEAKLEDLQPLYQAVAHGCQAGLHEAAYREVYESRIQRDNMHYISTFLGAFGTDLGAIACFFDQPWKLPSSSIQKASHNFLLSTAAFDLRALGRTTEAIEPTRAALRLDVANKDWRNAALASTNLCELELTLGDVAGAIRNAEQSIVFGDRGGKPIEKVIYRATLADAFHQAGRRGDAMAGFLEAESMQARFEVSWPLLYSLRGFQYCDLLLAESERAAWHAFGKAGYPLPTAAQPDEDIAPHIQRCREVEQRAAEILKGDEVLQPLEILVDRAFAHVTLGRAALYRIILENAETQNAKFEIAQAVEGFRRSGYTDHLCRGLLTRAWLRVVDGDADGARSDLDDAWQIAERGPMRLHMADILLHRARLFRNKEDLQKARALIEHCGYWRRKQELEDAEEAAKNWRDATRPIQERKRTVKKTIVELDLKGYSDIAREIEEHFSAEMVGKFNDQIRAFVDAGLNAVNEPRDKVFCASTGDGAILAFGSADDAHRFAQAVHKATETHNTTKTLASAKRWFRIGAATGDIAIEHADGKNKIAGTIIATAVRLESAAKTGEFLIDIATFQGLSAKFRNLYGDEEEVTGKRQEKFRAHRCVMAAVQSEQPDKASILTATDCRPTLDPTPDTASPALAPQRPTIREKSAAEILANLKGITLSYQFHEKVKDLYLGRWTQKPGWQATVFSLPSQLSGGPWFCSLKEVGSGIHVMASTAQDISALRPGDSVSVSGRISGVSRLNDVSLEDAIVLGENMPFP